MKKDYLKNVDWFDVVLKIVDEELLVFFRDTIAEYEMRNYEYSEDMFECEKAEMLKHFGLK